MLAVGNWGNGLCGLSAVKFVRPEDVLELDYATIPNLTLMGNRVMIRLLKQKRSSVIHTCMCPGLYLELTACNLIPNR